MHNDGAMNNILGFQIELHDIVKIKLKHDHLINDETIATWAVYLYKRKNITKLNKTKIWVSSPSPCVLVS